MLNLSSFEWSSLGSTELLAAGHELGEVGLLFEKIEDDAIQMQLDRLERIKKENEATAYKANPIRQECTFDDFMKLDMRVGTVLECTKVPKADKLLQFKIDDGLETRTILSGVAKHFKPEELVGKQVCFIANLPPRTMRGIVSEGMILSAEDNEGKLSLLTVNQATKPGSEIK